MEPVCVIRFDDWHGLAQAKVVMKALSAAGSLSLFVGGCVRNTLLGEGVTEIDMATPETPERVLTLLKQAGLRGVKTGIDHGTITAICGGKCFQITTLRKDIENFGRRARVEYTLNWNEDAARRDLTLNALYCDIKGNVFDPLDGLADLKARRIRFVGNPKARIKEDILRLLRYFRFYAYYGTEPADDRALAACREFAPKLSKLSAERVWGELSKLFLAQDPTPALAMMKENTILSYLLPEVVCCDSLKLLIQLEKRAGLQPDYLRRLAAIVDLCRDEASILASRLKFSKADRLRFCNLCEPTEQPDPQKGQKHNRAIIYRLGKNFFIELSILRGAKFPDKDWLSLLELAEVTSLPPFPIKGPDVISSGITEGARVGEIIKGVETWWIEGDFSADRQACLRYLDYFIGQGI